MRNPAVPDRRTQEVFMRLTSRKRPILSAIADALHIPEETARDMHSFFRSIKDSSRAVSCAYYGEHKHNPPVRCDQCRSFCSVTINGLCRACFIDPKPDSGQRRDHHRTDVAAPISEDRLAEIASMAEVDREIAERLILPDAPREEYTPSEMRYVATETQRVICDGVEYVLNGLCFCQEPISHTRRSTSRPRGDHPRLGQRACAAVSAGVAWAGTNIGGG